MKRYKLDLSYKEQKEIGFRYDPKLDEYIYEFPVYSCNGKASIVCKLGINDDTKEIFYNICDTMGRVYHGYYVRNYGKSKVISAIDRNLKKQLNKIGAKEIKEKKYGKHKN